MILMISIEHKNKKNKMKWMPNAIEFSVTKALHLTGSSTQIHILILENAIIRFNCRHDLHVISLIAMYSKMLIKKMEFEVFKLPCIS